jgi:hypothetical protein
MSIYATLWEIKVPRHHPFDDEWVKVYAQAVPPHIGHPSHYPEGDPYSDFLPPVVRDCDADTCDVRFYRAVVIVQEGRERKDIQRYVDPLLVMSGEEYANTSFHQLLERIHQAMGWDESVVAMSFTPSGEKKIIRVKK